MVDGCLVFPFFDDVKDVEIFVSLIYDTLRSAFRVFLANSMSI